MGKMRVLKATAKNILETSQMVKKGGLVIFPTDTVYGLGCDPFNVEAVKRIFAVKGERKKPLPVLASDIDSVIKIVHLHENAFKVAMKFWPGPLTLILSKKSTLPDVVTCKLDTVGVRIPQLDIAIQLIRLSGGLLVGTSANKTGEKPARNVSEITEKLGKEVDIILDGGPTLFGKPSTIVDLTVKKPKILRKGSIGLKEIVKVLH